MKMEYIPLSTDLDTMYLNLNGGEMQGSLKITDSIGVGSSNNLITKGSFSVGSGNVAGSNYYYITAIDIPNKKFTLGNSSEEEFVKIQVGYVYSCQACSYNFDFYGKVTAVDVATRTVTVDTMITGTFVPSSSSNNMWFPEHPECGDLTFTGGQSAIGENCIACQKNSHAEGESCIASGKRSHAEGEECRAAYCSHAEGLSTGAYGIYCHSEGGMSKAYVRSSHAEGESTVAMALAAHSEGYQTSAYSNGSHSEGQQTFANHWSCHAEGFCTSAIVPYAHAEGAYSIAGQSVNPSSIRACHVEGLSCVSIGDGAHSEGLETSSLNYATHAEGHKNLAKGSFSHAEGNETKAFGAASHSEGSYTHVYGTGSHVAGTNCVLCSDYSYAWNGSSSQYVVKNTRAKTFNINPEGGLSGFYIQHNNLKDMLDNMIDRICSAAGITDKTAISNIKAEIK